MARVNSPGVILIGSTETAIKSSLSELLSVSFGRESVCVGETSDLLLEAIDRQVELAIIDTNIKGLPLTKVLQILRKCRPRVPIIVVSGDYTVATGSRIMEQGVFYYTYKPLDMGSFKEIIESALKKRAKERELERR
jgi:two-component system, NtrC family, nitrogen regulation response regulator GlnG